MKRLLALVVAIAAQVAAAGMALNPDVTPDTLARTVCTPGYTGTVRPSVLFTNGIKYRLLDAAGIPRANAHQYELDHIVPLTLGGAPRSTDNLQLQPWDGRAGAKVKDKLEVRLNKLVCAGKLPLSEAQACIYTDWQACAIAHPSLSTKESK